MNITDTYDVGFGAAHVNFSVPLDLAIVTCHFDQDVSIIHMTSGDVWDVKITDQLEQDGHFIQSHLNYVSQDGKYFYLFATEDGDFVEINLETKSVTRRTHTGGTPEQSTS
jgi:hypothetical protein